jgi:CheY-like chemotaxis protein
LARKILLADDSVTAQNMGRRILSEAGYEVVTVNNGPAALKKIAEHKPHLVILDVYMPGYGGIEVCQRIKDSEETAHIPVLLTVGKLEPFKAEEARRVRADGHLVKPFEASELLTILTKLEDKIVPEPDPQARSRSAGLATARPSPTAAKGKGFGDADSGWKERLVIPSATKPKLPEPPPDSKGATAFRDFAHEKEPGPVEAAPRAPAAHPGLGQDITAEEIAAITAAAAAFAEKGEQAEPPAAQAAVPGVPGTIEQAEVPPKVSEEPPAEPEVAAALESLAPSNGNGGVAGAPIAEHAAEVEKPEEVALAVGMAAAYAGGAQGPRWIAEQVAVAPDEASLILEREMQKAYAALADVDAGRMGFPETQGEVPSFRESETVPQPVEVAAIAQQSESYALEPGSMPGEPASEASAVDAPPADQQPPETVAEAAPVEESAELSPVPEMAAPNPAEEVTAAPESASAPADAIATPAASLADESPAKLEPAEPTPTADELAPEPPPETAYAAAASVGAAFRTINPGEGSQTPASNEPAECSPSSVPETTTPEREAELAAAWANWKQVRESLASPQFVSQVAAAAEAEFKEVHRQVPPAWPPKPEDDSTAPEDPAAIANIVDSVLAELKPKLVEEIAKKLGKDQK